MTRDGGTGTSGGPASGGPLIGRGSAWRAESAGAEADDGPAPAATGTGRADDDRDRRWVARPTLARSSRGRRWLGGDSATPRTRLVLGLVLVVALAVAWAWVSQSTPATGPRATATTRARPEPRARRIVAVPSWVPAAIAATCTARDGDQGDAPDRVVVDCTPGRGVVRLQYRDFPSVAALRAAYDDAAPPDEGLRRGGAGAARCARGVAEERSWSVAATPSEPDGRYRCSLVAGTARLVWSSERLRVLASASRADDDLRSLYEWWTSVPSPTAR